MKTILFLIISAALIVSGFGQTRNVLVGTNNAVVQPTNFWSADATNARSGLGLGSAATNAASAFQPASSILSNLVSGGALTFSNITIGVTNVTGLQTALNGKLSTNPTLAISNISNLQTTLDGKLGTNPTLQISNISGLQTNLDSKLSPTGSAASLTNFPTVALASNITGTAALATNVTGVVALTNGGTGATNAAGARTALGVGSTNVFVGLTNLGSGGNLGFSSSPYILGSTNSTAPNNAVLALDAAGVRSVAGLTLAALTNLDNASFRSAIGLGSSATNASSAFQPSSTVLSNLASNNGASLTNIAATNVVGVLATNGSAAGLTNFPTVALASNVTGTIAISNGGSGATTANGARTNLGLGATWLTNTAASNFRTAIGLGWSALTNTNTAGFNTSLYGSGTNPVLYNTNGEVVSPTNFWQQAPIATTVAFSVPATNSTNTATNSRNLIIQSLSSNIVNTTNTLLLPTNTSTFNGDTAVVIHAGGSGSATAIRQAGQTSNLISLTNFDHAVRFLYFNNTWDFYHNLAYVEPIYFSGTNAAAIAAASRTNLGLGATNNVEFNQLRLGGSGQMGLIGSAGNLGFYDSIDAEYVLFIPADTDPVEINSQWNDPNVRSNLGLPLPALTNTNNAKFQAAVFATNAIPTNSANVNSIGFNTAVAWMEVTVSTNGTNHSFRIPLFR